MSFAGYVSLFTGAADRLQKTRRLLDEADGNTGIVDDTTDANKAHLEHQGPGGLTGTSAAAVVDLYNMLSGGETGASIIIGNNELAVSDLGVGIGRAPVSGYDLAVGTGPTQIGGTMSVAGMLSCAGIAASGNVEVTTGYDLIVADGSIVYKEQNLSGGVGDEKQFIEMTDSYSNFIMQNPYSAADIVTFGEGPEVPVGSLLMNDNDGNMHFAFSTAGTYPVLNICDTDPSVVHDDADYSLLNVTPTLLMDAIGSLYGPTIVLRSVFSSPTDQGIIMSGGISPSNDVWKIVRGGSGDPLVISYNDDTILEIKDDVVSVRSDGDGGIFQVTGTVLDTVEYVKTSTAIVPHDNRLGAEPVELGVGLEFSWRGNTNYSAFMGIENFYEESSFRIYFDVTDEAGTIPNIALGKPLGDFSAPIDALNVLDSPFLVSVNSNYLWLNANHGDKEGLWVGRGDDSSSHKGARIWLQDQTGYRAAIRWGTTEEEFSTFIKDGVMMVTPSASPNSFGDTIFGASTIPTLVTTYDLTTEQASILALVRGGVSDLLAGGCVMIEDTNNVGELWVVGPDADKWFRFTADSSIADS